jgi:hypothetical protein
LFLFSPNKLRLKLTSPGISKAVEAREKIAAREVSGYEHCTTEWLLDPCAKPFPEGPWCSCAHCRINTAAQQAPRDFSFRDQYDASANSKAPTEFWPKNQPQIGQATLKNSLELRKDLPTPGSNTGPIDYDRPF